MKNNVTVNEINIAISSLKTATVGRWIY